ncbi:hypothetical protein [Sphingomonas sp. 3-13AW]|uniref:hypothetical protein n=1 Tax=Sphingomonas sp. 3-13AW TaxID=3050450 RepID=UPI003BB7AE5B
MKINRKTLEAAPIGTFSPPVLGGDIGVPSKPAATGQVVQMGDHVAQALAGITPMTGQNISVNVSAPSPHLSFGEWAKRGVLSALGNGLLFVPRLLGRLLEAILMGLLGILKVAAIIVLIPTLIWAGYRLQQHVSTSTSVREAASSVTVQGGEVLKGVADGAKAETDPLAAKTATSKNK